MKRVRSLRSFPMGPTRDHPLVPFVAEPGDDARELKPWLSRWHITAHRVAYVVAYVEAERRVVDVRYWIETLHDESIWPKGTIFTVIVEEEHD